MMTHTKQTNKQKVYFQLNGKFFFKKKVFLKKKVCYFYVFILIIIIELNWLYICFSVQFIIWISFQKKISITYRINEWMNEIDQIEFVFYKVYVCRLYWIWCTFFLLWLSNMFVVVVRLLVLSRIIEKILIYQLQQKKNVLRIIKENFFSLLTFRTYQLTIVKWETCS